MIDTTAKFDDFRAQAVAAVDAALHGAFQRFAPTLGLAEDRAVDAARYALDAGGKRVRGMLVLTSAAALRPGGEITADALITAASIECLHGYSLVHDDLPAMDNDAMRRGKPTTHLAYDEATAILAGDGLQALAFALLGSGLPNTDPVDALMLIAELATGAGFNGMVGGQMLDMLADASPAPFDLDTTKRLQAKKTGALLRYSCRAGAILNGERGDALAHLDRFGTKIGLAFQIVDDLLDLRGDAQSMGKAVGKDQNSGKATFIDLLGEQGAQDEVKRLIEQAVQSAGFLRNQANCSSQQNAIDQLVNIAEFIAKRHH